MTEEFLLDLGFSRNESKVYFNLLKSGLSTVSEISSNTSIHRTNIYDCLERLIEKGLVTYIYKGKGKKYQASNPNKIKDLLKEKEENFSKILPEMIKLRQSSPSNELVEIHRGINAVRLILNSFLVKKKEILAYGIPKMALSQIGRAHV